MGRPGEGKADSRAARTVLWGVFLALAAVAAWESGAAGSPASPAQAQAQRRTPSGLPVPRYVSLKFGEVNARAGPGDDYRLLWTYRARGLPLQVIAETPDWRRVCDPEGATAWVHQRTVDTRRTVMRLKPQPLPIRRRPAAASPPAAMLAGRSLAALESCRDGWCQVSAGRAKGWAPAAELWGADDRQQCRPAIATAR
ncbi:MAG TPA: SH3 domain-containing protein [Caulobacteraceae bacterium]|nr:SH3 domain-containing protein [Caulobacteraceae bacterium]